MSRAVSAGRTADQKPEVAVATDAGSARRRGRVAASVMVVVAAAAAVVAGVTGAFGGSGSPAAGTSGSYSTSAATVTRQSLTSQTRVDATLGDAGTYSVVNQVPGTITRLPTVGQVVRQGQALYQVSGTPVALLYGSVPAYRELSDGMTGPDVAELNADLAQLHYATAAELGPRPDWDYFSAATASALQVLQAHLGVTQTGTLDLGQAVFLPSAALITGLGTGAVAGGTAAPGSVILTASSTTPVVTIALDAAQQTEVQDGQQVSITLPDGATTPGTVSYVGNVATSSSSSPSSSSPDDSGGSGSGSPATITVQVSLNDPRAAGSLNQAPVQVTIVTGSVADALVVPVDALLAQAGGRYAVEVIGAGGHHHLVAVSLGVFDDAAGLVQVTGTGLAAGQRVVVPAT
jgi:Putative peptidoglycan binding domain